MGADKLGIKAFIRERDAALRSLDKKKITAYMDKYGIDWRPLNELVFWAGVHKARLSSKGFTAAEKRASVEWLVDHGFTAAGLDMEEIVEIQAMRGKL